MPKGVFIRKRVYPIDQIIKLYQSGMSIREVSKEIKTSDKIIKRELQKLNALRPPRINTFDDFIKQVNTNGDKNCWIWLGTVNNKGYGHFRSFKENMAHRYSYKHFKGDTCGLFVCHSCDNPRCVNPDHLFLGTRQDNMIDMSLKDRGNGISRGKLTNDIARQIRELKRCGVSTADLSRKFSIGYGAIQRIVSFKTYKRA